MDVMEKFGSTGKLIDALNSWIDGPLRLRGSGLDNVDSEKWWAFVNTVMNLRVI
jgi:hypothetical protein